MPRSRPRHYRISAEDIREAHAEALEYSDNEPVYGVLSLEAIEAAAVRPFNGYYRTIHHRAAVLCEAIVRWHPFVDGNKRTALIAVNLFLQRSGYRLRYANAAAANAEAAMMLESLAAGATALPELIQWFRDRIVRLD